MREADPVHNVELRVDRYGHESVVFAFPYRREVVDAVRAIPGRRFDWEAKEWWALQADQTAPYVKGVIERHPWLKVAPDVERWLAQATDGWVGRVGAGKRLGAGRFVLETIAGELDDDLAPLAESAGGRLWLPFTRRGRERARRAAGLALRRARAALRAPAAGRARAGAGDAVADRQRGGAALQARRQLGPGDDPRLPRAARLRGARALAAGRPLPARAARALPAHLRRRGRARTPPTCSSACGASTTSRSRTSAARAPTTGRRWRSSRSLGGELRPFQRAGVAYALKARRTFLADEQGLGKTVQALGAIEADDAYPAVVICPASLKLNWLRETEHWLPHRSVTVVSGTGATPPLAEITILNYEIVVAHRARLALAQAARARARRVPLRQEPARQAHAGGAAAGRGAARGRAAARAHRHAGHEPPRRADRAAARARAARRVRLRRPLLAPLPGQRARRSASTGTCAAPASCAA